MSSCKDIIDQTMCRINQSHFDKGYNACLEDLCQRNILSEREVQLLKKEINHDN